MGVPRKSVTSATKAWSGRPPSCRRRSRPMRPWCSCRARAGRRTGGGHLPFATLKQLLRTSPRLHELLQRYTQAVLAVTAQAAACHSVHAVEARAARWLLQVHDRVPGDEFPLTHEFLALMLAVRRATVTSVMGTLQRQGGI